MNESNQENQNFNFFLDLKFIPQVILLSSKDNSFQFAINSLLKKIVCQKGICSDKQLCNNCQKIINNSYLDLTKYQFNKINSMKKQDVINIINKLSLQSLETGNPKICLLEGIEYNSLEASNSFLKFLETVPNNTFLILTTTKIEKILPTIISRCQIFDIPKIKNNKSNFLNWEKIEKEQQELILNLVTSFINYDNEGNFTENFFLIKKILSLKENLILFFQLLLTITEDKIMKLNNITSLNNQLINDFTSSWNNQDQLFLKNLIKVLIETINKINNVNNLNWNLLLNAFFINIYQGLENDKL